uniref:Uncharacterized protein n=1 Tax=Anguilla anguilla TaxID=7936 RepID=A0A0E9XF01_ANGAN
MNIPGNLFLPQGIHPALHLKMITTSLRDKESHWPRCERKL